MHSSLHLFMNLSLHRGVTSTRLNQAAIKDLVSSDPRLHFHKKTARPWFSRTWWFTCLNHWPCFAACWVTLARKYQVSHHGANLVTSNNQGIHLWGSGKARFEVKTEAFSPLFPFSLKKESKNQLGKREREPLMHNVNIDVPKAHS